MKSISSTPSNTTIPIFMSLHIVSFSVVFRQNKCGAGALAGTCRGIRPSQANYPATKRRKRFLSAGVSDILRLDMPSSAKYSTHELPLLELTEISQAVQKKEVSPVELTQACLARIERLNPKLNAFIAVTDTSALEAARKAEAEIARGEWKGPLHGIPLAIKDLVETAGVKTTAASSVLKNNVPAADAEVIRRLKSAGAILLGKLNL